MTTLRTYRNRVQRGITYLNGHLPDWADRIEADTLDLEDDRACVLGQVLGSFYTACANLELSDFEAQNMGFVVLDAREPQVEFSILTECWREALEVQ